MANLIPIERIENRIYLIRGQKVMLGSDLAELYGVKTKVLNQAVRRNISRFPSDFLFRLNLEEFDNLRSQNVTSSHGGIRYLPHAFTEYGVAMLSSVLNSERAIQVNILIMRTFGRLRQILSTHKDLHQKLRELEGRVKSNDSRITDIFEAIRKLMVTDKNRNKIGFLR